MSDTCPDCGSTYTTCWPCKDQALANVEQQRDESRAAAREAIRVLGLSDQEDTIPEMLKTWPWLGEAEG